MKKSFILAAILFLVCFVVAGCNSDNYEYLELEASSVPINENGGLNEVSKLGVTLSAPENTFDSNEGIKIVVTESEGQGTKQLSLASKVYTIRAFTKKGVEITNTDKPVSLKIVNSASPDQESYMGICENNSWHYSSMNSPSTSSTLRASKTETLQIYKFGISAAVFVRNPEAESTAVVSDADVTDKKIKVQVDEEKFLSDMPIEIVMEGNADAMGMSQSDFLINIRFQNNNQNDEALSIIGGSAQITTDKNEKSAFNGQFVHKITVSNVTPQTKGQSITAGFKMNLKGKYIKDFAKKFTIDIVNSPKSQKFESLPFQYSTSVDVVDTDPASEPVPLPPTDINVEPSEITPNSVIRIVWKPAQDATGYKLIFKNTSSGIEQEFNNITGTEWTSEGSNLNLTEGNYQIMIASRNSKGIYCEPYILLEFNIPPAGEDVLTTPILNDFAPVCPLNSQVAVSWHASTFTSAAGETGEVKYDVYVDTVENPAIKYKEDISETECSILAENITTAGMYYVKVVAKHGDMTASSEVKSFEAKSSALANPVIAGVQTEPYATGNTLEITWEPITDPFGNPIKYAIKLYTGETIPEASTEENITATSWSKELTEAGNFKVVVVADNGNGQTSQSAPVAFEVVGIPEKPELTVTDLSTYGEAVNVSWNTCANAESYDVFVYKDGESVPENAKATITDTSCNIKDYITAPGLYNVFVVAKAKIPSLTNKSDEKQIKLLEIPETPINVVLSNKQPGQMLSAQWEAGNEAAEVTYHVALVKDSVVVSTGDTSALTWTDTNALSIGSYEFSVSAENAAGVSASATVNFDVTPNTITVKVADDSLIEDKTKLIPVIQVVFDFEISDECKSLFEGKFNVASTGAAITSMVASWSEDAASPTLNISFDDYLEPMTAHYVAFDSDLISNLETNYGITFNNLTSGKFEFTTVLWEGAGTGGDPYQVLFPIQFTEIKEPYLGCNFVQLCDISFGGATIEPIGDFSGMYDGLSHTLSDIKISTSGLEKADSALFCSTTSTGRILSVNVDNLFIESDYNVAVLCSTNNGEIDGCHISSGTVYAPDTYMDDKVSGLTAVNNGRISDSSFQGTIYGFCYCAGITGQNTSTGEITTSYAQASITSIGNMMAYSGGLVGRNAGHVERCYVVNTQIDAYGSYGESGGFVGENTGSITNCYAKNITVSASTTSGGLVGYSTNSATMTNCFATGKLIDGNYDGNSGSSCNCGISGKVATSTPLVCISNCFIAGNFSVTGSAFTHELGGNGGPQLFNNKWSTSHLNCYYLETGYNSSPINGWTSDWDTDIWEIPTGSFTKDNPCLPKLIGVGGQE